MKKDIDLARLLPIAGFVLTALGYVLDVQRREQDNREIAREVARILKEEKI